MASELVKSKPEIREQPQLSAEQKKALWDHTGGPLQQVVEELAKSVQSIDNYLSLSVVDATTALKATRPDVFTAYEKLLTSAAAACALSDEAALQWKEIGNADFAKGDLDMAAVNFTKGMTAVLSSSVLAVLLNNRSTVFFKQGRHRDACMDANEALRLDPTYWKALERRGCCLERLGFLDVAQNDLRASIAQESTAGNSTQAVDDILWSLSSQPSKEVLSAPSAVCSSKISVERDAKGRHFIAKERMTPSQILLETPYASAPKLEGLLTSCAFCFKRTPSLFPSHDHRKAGIKSRGLFCGAKCASLSWSEYGEREQGHVFFLLCPTDALLAWRMINARRDSIQICSFDGGDERPLLDPLTDNKFGASHVNTLCAFSRETVAFAEVGGYETIVTVLATACGAVSSTQAEQFRKAMRQVLVNAFHVSSIDRVMQQHDATNTSHSFAVVSSGKAIYSVAAVMNHSCDPNCFVSWVGGPHGCSSRISIRLIRPVMEGEELTVSYNNIARCRMHSTRGRIRALRAQFGFCCTCTACRSVVDEPVSEEEKQHYIKAADYFQKGKRLIREGQFKVAINVLFQSYEIVMRDICPPPRPPQPMLAKTHDALAQAYLLDGEKTKCVEHLLAALELDRQLNGDLYPELVRDYTRLAFLSSEPKQFADESVRLLELFYAPSAHLDAEIAYVRSSQHSSSV